MNENELTHFGIPGMKWGKRKQPERSGSGNTRKISQKELRKQRKAILRDYNNTLRYHKQDYRNKLSSGKIKGNEKDYMTKTYDDMIKKYGKKKLADAQKYQNRVANVGSFIGAAAGASLAAILASKGLI